MKEASTLIEEIKASPQYRNRNVVSTNDLYTNAILGFYEGDSYSHCLQLFKSIRPTGEYNPDTASPEWKQIQNSKCYSSVIGSCFRLGDFAATQYFYHESRKMGVFPNYLESLMVAESFLRTGAGEKRLEELRKDTSACKGIPEGERSMRDGGFDCVENVIYFVRAALRSGKRLFDRFSSHGISILHTVPSSILVHLQSV